MQKQGYRIRFHSNLGRNDHVCLYVIEAKDLDEANAYAVKEHGENLLSVRYTKHPVYTEMSKDGPNPECFSHCEEDDIKAVIKRAHKSVSHRFEDMDAEGVCSAVDTANEELGDKVSARAWYNLYAYRWSDLVNWAT